MYAGAHTADPCSVQVASLVQTGAQRALGLGFGEGSMGEGLVSLLGGGTALQAQSGASASPAQQQEQQQQQQQPMGVLDGLHTLMDLG